MNFKEKKNKVLKWICPEIVFEEVVRNATFWYFSNFSKMVKTRLKAKTTAIIVIVIDHP